MPFKYLYPAEGLQCGGPPKIGKPRVGMGWECKIRGHGG